MIRFFYHKIINRDTIDSVIVLTLSLCLFVETGIGLLQIFGIKESNNAFFILTGHFINPGPYGGFIATLVAICGSYYFLRRYDSKGWTATIRVLSGVAALVGFIVLPASLSRASWLGLFSALSLFTFKNFGAFKTYLSHHPWIYTIILSLLVLGGTGAFLMKQKSALGRFLIWRIECRIIDNHPMGIGNGTFGYEYGLEQARFFCEKERSKTIVNVAGCPEYAFNEYLKIGVKYGYLGLIISLLIAIICCIVLVRRDSPLGYGAIVLAIFAFFSYPFEFYSFQLLGTLFISASISFICHEKLRNLPYLFFLCVVVCIYINSRIIVNVNASCRDMYQEGHTLFLNGYYQEALTILEEGSMLSSDPMFHNVIGRCHEALGDYSKAEQEYILAYYMVPCRLYPLVLLQELYISRADTLKAKAVFKQIKELPINPRNPNMKNLLERAEKNMLPL